MTGTLALTTFNLDSRCMKHTCVRNVSYTNHTPRPLGFKVIILVLNEMYRETMDDFFDLVVFPSLKRFGPNTTPRRYASLPSTASYHPSTARNGRREKSCRATTLKVYIFLNDR